MAENNNLLNAAYALIEKLYHRLLQVHENTHALADKKLIEEIQQFEFTHGKNFNISIPAFFLIKDPENNIFALFESNNDTVELEHFAGFCGISKHSMSKTKIRYFELSERQARFARFCGAKDIDIERNPNLLKDLYAGK